MVSARLLRLRSRPRLAVEIVGAAVLVLGCSGTARWASGPEPTAFEGWPAYGGDPGGTRYSSLSEINPGNVSQLRVAWTYRTGDLADSAISPSRTKFEATPILVFGTLYFSTPFNRVIALNPETGAPRWTYDPGVDRSIKYAESLISRGVSAWGTGRGTCGRRIFLATIDARLIALDAMTGAPCHRFGVDGTVDLTADGVGRIEPGEYAVTSPPAVVNDVVVVGSAIGDNRRVWVERGMVRAYDAKTGRLRWTWDPIPRSPAAPGWEAWGERGARLTGGANAWSVISADPGRDLVFVPTGSAAPDFYGGLRPGSDLLANSVVALRASTGELVWYFQAVHHDLWDYDVASQPTLATLMVRGDRVPVVIQPTKMGRVFVLDRDTGKPVFPVDERSVPASNVPGESAWPTQPFPTFPTPLHPSSLDPEDAFGADDKDRLACRKRIEALRFEGTFTPPSIEGTLVYPGFVGGTNWGSAAFDPVGSVLVLAQNRLAAWVRLIPRARFRAAAREGEPGAEFTAQEGTPYGMARGFLSSPKGVPCSPPPWGTLTAVDLTTGAVRWQVPLGVIPSLASLPQAEKLGSPNLGGPIVTAGGLVFIGAAMDNYLRAFNLESGLELWKGALPAGGQATPMTYRAGNAGKQFVVIAAGGHEGLETTLGDYLVAFALP